MEKQVAGQILHSVVRQGVQEDGSAEETCLEAAVVLCKIRFQAFNHILPCTAFDYSVLESEQSRCLHSVEHAVFETSVIIEECFPNIGLRFPDHSLVFGRVPACIPGHIQHHSGIYNPVGCPEIVPVLQS